MDDIDMTFCNITFCGECKYFKQFEASGGFYGMCGKDNFEMLAAETCEEAERKEKDDK